MIRQATTGTTISIAALVTVLISFFAPCFVPSLAGAQAAESAKAKAAQFSCSGVKIEPVSLKQAPMTVKLNLISPRKIAFDPGTGDIKSTVTGNDQITLHFRTKNFTGEFFHYTNDLFLIYRSGHLAKLSCTPA
jgi:hypothetical protein